MPLVREIIPNYSKSRPEYLLENGRFYALVEEFTLTSDEVLEICLRTDTPIISIEAIGLGTSSVQVDVELREDVIFTDLTGTPITSINKNRNFRNEVLPINNAEIDPVVVDEGLLVEGFSAYGQSGQGSSKAVFTSGGIEVPYVLEPSNGYMLRLTNRDTNIRVIRLNMYLSY